MTAPIQVVETIDQAAALLDPTRLRLVRALSQPDSASGLSRRIGLPRQQINYHLRALEHAGLVELVERRIRGNCVERVLAAKATAYVIDPQILADLGGEPAAVQDRFSWAYLVALAAKAVKELAELRRAADDAKQKLATFAFDMPLRFKSPSAALAFHNDLVAALANLASQYHDEKAQDGRTFRLFGGAYPALTKPAAPSPASRGDSGGLRGSSRATDTGLSRRKSKVAPAAGRSRRSPKRARPAR